MAQNLKLASSCRFGAYATGIAGIIYSVLVLCALTSPDSIASYVASAEYFLDFASYKWMFIILKCLLFFANLSMIGVVCAFHTLSRNENQGLMNIISLFAIIGFSIGMYQSIQDATMVPYLANAYQHGNHLIRQVIIALGVANPALYILSMGLPGIWFLVVSIKALSNPMIPKHLIILGLLWGSGNLMTVVAHVLIILPLIRLVTMGALLFAPLWSFGECRFLLKLSKQLSAPESTSPDTPLS